MEEERFAAARVAALYRLARPAYFATVINPALLLIVLWGAFPAPHLLAWFGLIIVVSLARLALARAYARNGAAGVPQRWELRFVAGVAAASLLWVVPPAMFLPGSDPLMQLAVVFVIGGNIIGAAAVYAASASAFYGFSVLPFFTVVLQLAKQGGPTYPLLALMVAVFGAVMVGVYRNIHSGIVHTLRTRIENEELVARLAGSEAQLRTAVDDALGRVAELQRAQDAYGQLAAQEKLVLDTLPV